MMVEPCSQIPKISSVIHLEWVFKGSKQHPYLPLTPLVPSDLMNHVVQLVEQPEQKPGPVEEPSPFIGPTYS